MSQINNSVIFPIGEKFESDNFNGTVWLNMLTPFGTPCPIGNRTFEPGCRNSWHIAGNLSIGNDKQTLINAVTQCLPYIGYPRTLNALGCINEVTAE